MNLEESIESIINSHNEIELLGGLENIKQIKKDLVDELMRLSIFERKINEQLNKIKDK